MFQYDNLNAQESYLEDISEVIRENERENSCVNSDGRMILTENDLTILSKIVEKLSADVQCNEATIVEDTSAKESDSYLFCEVENSVPVENFYLASFNCGPQDVACSSNCGENPQENDLFNDLDNVHFQMAEPDSEIGSDTSSGNFSSPRRESDIQLAITNIIQSFECGETDEEDENKQKNTYKKNEEEVVTGEENLYDCVSEKENSEMDEFIRNLVEQYSIPHLEENICQSKMNTVESTRENIKSFSLDEENAVMEEGKKKTFEQNMQIEIVDLELENGNTKQADQVTEVVKDPAISLPRGTDIFIVGNKKNQCRKRKRTPATGTAGTEEAKDMEENIEHSSMPGIYESGMLLKYFEKQKTATQLVIDLGTCLKALDNHIRQKQSKISKKSYANYCWGTQLIKANKKILDAEVLDLTIDEFYHEATLVPIKKFNTPIVRPTRVQFRELAATIFLLEIKAAAYILKLSPKAIQELLLKNVVNGAWRLKAAKTKNIRELLTAPFGHSDFFRIISKDSFKEVMSPDVIADLSEIRRTRPRYA